MKTIGILLVESLPVPPVLGGAVENLVQLLIDSNEGGNQLCIHVFSVYNKKAEALAHNYNNTKFVYYKNSGIKRISDVFFKIVRRFSRTILGTVTPSLYEIEAYGYFKKKGIDTIVIENAPHYALFLNRKSEFCVIQHLHNDYLKKKNDLTDRIFRCTQRFIGVSKFIERRVRETAACDVDVKVCYNGINLRRFSTINSDDVTMLRRRLGITANDKVIIFVGRLTENKGLLELLSAFKGIAKLHRDWKLLIIGGLSFSSNTIDDYVAKLRSIAVEIGEQVLMTGYVDYEQIPIYYHLAHLCVVPSTEVESFNLVSVEAQASAVPVIVSDAGGIVETIFNESGLIVKRDESFVENLARSMEKILSDENLRERMSNAALVSANRFPSEAMCEKFVELVK